MTSSVLHLLAMAVWLGGLAALLTTLHQSDGPLPAASVARFSRLAFASVTVLVRDRRLPVLAGSRLVGRGVRHVVRPDPGRQGLRGGAAAGGGGVLAPVDGGG